MEGIAVGQPHAAPSRGSGSAPFVRSSSGLVRTGTPLRTFMMSLAWGGIGTYMAFFYFYGGGAFPDSNLIVGLAFAAVLNLVFAVVWNLLSVAYPRSGGEYVYLSRILHPVIGFALSVAACMANIFWAAVGGFWVCTLVISPIALVYGGVTGSSSAISFGNWMADTHHAWLIGAISIILAAGLLSFGMNAYYRYQRIMFWLGWIGFAVFLVVFAVTSHGAFVHGVNNYGQVTAHVKDAFQTTIASAHRAGMPGGFSLWHSMAYAAFAVALGGSAYIGGEVRNPRRSQLLGGAGAVALLGIVSLLIGVLLVKTVGTEFNRSASFLAINGSKDYAFNVTPTYIWYGFLGTSSQFLLIVMGVGFAIWSVFWIPVTVMYATRMIFAWSFDRLVPASLTSVTKRSNSPLAATWLTAIIAEVILYLYQRGTLAYVAPLMLYGFVWAGVSIAAMLFPYLPKTRLMFERSNINWRVARIPLLTIGGALSLAYWVISLYFNFTTAALGANSTKMKWFVLGCIAIPAIYYLVMSAYRRTRGVDVNLAFAELPPE